VCVTGHVTTAPPQAAERALAVSEAARVDAIARATVRARVMRRLYSVRADVVAPLLTYTVATLFVAQAAERALAMSEAARNAATARATVRCMCHISACFGHFSWVSCFRGAV
jgi:hypothetical protein